MALEAGGWKWLDGATKAHWFKKQDGRSLCRRWTALSINNLDDTAAHKSPDNCLACSRKRLAMEAPDAH